MTKKTPIIAPPGLQVSPEDADLLAIRWHVNNGYARGKRDGERFYLHDLIARRMGIEGPPDHENRDRLDNRRDNLRPATRSQNSANQPGHSDRISVYKGVTPGRRGIGWRAQVGIDGKTIGLGTFGTEEEAARAYDKAARHFHGEFAVCNFEGTEAASPAEILAAAKAARSRFGIPGVTWNKREKRFKAFAVGEGSKYRSLGGFERLEDAVAAARAQQEGARRASS